MVKGNQKLEQRLDLAPGTVVIKKDFMFDYLLPGIAFSTWGTLVLGNAVIQEAKRGLLWVAGYECQWVDHEDSSFGHYEVGGRKGSVREENEDEW